MAGSCEHVNKASDFIKGVEFDSLLLCTVSYKMYVS
jgi:hypothetical protein